MTQVGHDASVSLFKCHYSSVSSCEHATCGYRPCFHRGPLAKPLKNQKEYTIEKKEIENDKTSPQ